jgi:hypothetical protein
MRCDLGLLRHGDDPRARPRPRLWARAKEKRINLRFVDADHLGISFDQSVRREELEAALERVPHRCAGADLDRCRGQGAEGDDPGALAPHVELSHPSGLLDVSLGNRDAALPPAPAGEGRGARPGDDSARLLHHEAQRHDGDDPRHLAFLLDAASLRTIGAGAGLHAALRGARGHAGRDHRLRCRLSPAQRRKPGRICGASRHQGLSPVTGRCASRRLPHSGLGAWHQSGVRRDGGHEGDGRRL